MTFESSASGFSLEKAIGGINTYILSTGVNCFIIDSKGEIIYTSQKANHLCKSCRDACGMAHLYGSYQAERFGGKYVYFCPVGLVYWASPITVKDTLQAAMIGGPVLMMTAEDFLIEDLIRLIESDESRIDTLKNCMSQVPVKEPEVVNALSDLLFILASSFCVGNASYREEQRKSHEIQAKISESVHKIKNLYEDKNASREYPYEREKELMQNIVIGDKQSSQKILNELLGYVFFSSGKDFEVIKARALELTVLLSRAALEGGAESEEIFGLNFKYLSEIHMLRNVEELTVWLSKIMARFTDCVFNLANMRHKDTMFKAITYIKRNYTERITLEEVAGHVYLNPSYFSKIFSSEVKSSFVSYVNSLRIKAAKELLLDSTIPLAEISSLSGFEDQSYFTKVFKKSTGITPGKFRSRKGT